jgi:hypothetical protein
MLGRVEEYLRDKLASPDISLKQSASDPDMAEVYVGDEFVGTLYKDDEDGETSFDFNMSILESDVG